VFGLTLLTVVAVPALGLLSEDYARFLAQLIIPAVLALGATVVGALFGIRRK
jgi:hypothetical protein